MRNKLMIAGIFLSLAACSGRGSAAGGSASASSGGGSGDSTYSGDNMFSYTFNGRKVTIRDFMHNGDGKNYLALYLNHVTNDGGMVSIEITNQMTSEVFNINVSNSGTTKVSHYTPSLTNFRDKKTTMAEFMSHLKNYYGEDVTVTITAIDATHVAGTFSGKYLSGGNKPVPVEVTDGKFDLRFTKAEGN
jgi:hypothetical protein